MVYFIHGSSATRESLHEQGICRLCNESADRCRWTLGRASSQLATLCQDHLDQRGFHEREYEGHLALELNIEIQKSGDLAEVNDVESGPRRVLSDDARVAQDMQITMALQILERI